MQAFFDAVLRLFFDVFPSSDRLGWAKKMALHIGVP